eukprot:CAMPEP_0197285380 /NCGR_PEP_ID=MMETSP0890-20130614/615_1 /TAXON_ID=44058 ORGANISM="Aureoumbra lagunensis, Strain CCMP1510" /NCGR_SAMPLE_ID=MMETSP0890 /ASSEMBLY_ACC=CAM_ASM_000533 /LENGTH=367 /DNA_ID=CAMNT_0042752799 /DNA_START=78 /DNA_END=1181 /DNA_ORIENTATION=-
MTNMQQVPMDLDGSAHPLVSDFVGLENQPGDMSTEDVRDLSAAAELASNANISLQPDSTVMKGPSVTLGPPVSSQLSLGVPPHLQQHMHHPLSLQHIQSHPHHLQQSPPPPPPPITPLVHGQYIQQMPPQDSPLTGLASAATTQQVGGGGFTIGKKPETEIQILHQPRPSPKSTVASSTGKTKGDYQKKYRSTEKGKLAQKKAQEKYRKSDKGKQAQNKARKKWRESNPYQRNSSGAKLSPSNPSSPPPPPPPTSPPPPLPAPASGPPLKDDTILNGQDVSAASPADAAAVASLSNLGASQTTPTAISNIAIAPTSTLSPGPTLASNMSPSQPPQSPTLLSGSGAVAVSDALNALHSTNVDAPAPAL